MIVNLILVWIVDEPFELYEGKEIFTHVLIPVAGTFNLLLCNVKVTSLKKLVVITQIPIIIYSAWYLLMVFILKVWSDFYSVGFLFPYSLPIFFILLLGLSVGLSLILAKIKLKK